MHTRRFNSSLATALAWTLAAAAGHSASAQQNAPGKFDPQHDLLSLHYDHAPDQDDGHSAAADRTILQSMFDLDWIKDHVVAVSGAYGENAKTFNDKSDAVMDAVFHDCGRWLDAHADHNQAVAELVDRWTDTIEAGGDIWVKEGGQSDITAEVVRKIQEKSPNVGTTQRIHVVQHSKWNEDQTTDAALAYVKRQTDYIKIRDANAFLNIKGGDAAFEQAARSHPAFGPPWTAAFAYYDPDERLDFSDTGELMHILGLGEVGIEEFMKRYLRDSGGVTPATAENSGRALRGAESD